MNNESSNRKLGFWSLTAIIIGMMVGSGLYNIPQNLAVSAGPLATSIAWIITAFGMLTLVMTFKVLADCRPDLDAGIYQYTQAGFGNFAGFNIAWGYWLCTAFSNVAYAVMLNDSFGAFWSPLLSHGWETLLFGTILIWAMYFIVCRGIQTARLINNLLVIIKVTAIIVAVILLFLNFRYGILASDIWTEGLSFSDISSQVKNTMIVTLWCFIGIEGAVMMAARAKKPSDVGKAGVAGFFIAWLLYVLVSMLCFGVMSRARLAGLEDPSVAYVLQAICGQWAYYFVIVAIIVSLLGGWLAWTLICAQVPYEAAGVKIFPKSFLKLNHHGMPSYGLLVSSVVMEIFLIMVLFADKVYLVAINVSSMMILPAYLMSGIFLCKIATRPGLIPGIPQSKRIMMILLGLLCSIYCAWLIYAGGLELLAFTSFFYLAGCGFYLRSRRERKAIGPLRPTLPDVITILLIAAGLVTSIILLACGQSPF